jgi:hypothetical protein
MVSRCDYIIVSGLNARGSPGAFGFDLWSRHEF